MDGGGSDKKSFWNTLPGILTGIAGTVTGIVALITTLAGLGYLNGPKPKPTPTPVSSPSPKVYRVVGVERHDFLFVRSKPGQTDLDIGKIPPNGTNIMITGDPVRVGSSIWVPIKYGDIIGWVNKSFLTEQ